MMDRNKIIAVLKNRNVPYGSGSIDTSQCGRLSKDKKKKKYNHNNNNKYFVHNFF